MNAISVSNTAIDMEMIGLPDLWGIEERRRAREEDADILRHRSGGARDDVGILSHRSRGAMF